jgi:hypothetical protein
MQNELPELKFTIEFTRQEIELIISDPSVQYIVISGTYTYSGKSSSVEIFNSNRDNITPPSPLATPCPKPCP